MGKEGGAAKTSSPPRRLFPRRPFFPAPPRQFRRRERRILGGSEPGAGGGLASPARGRGRQRRSADSWRSRRHPRLPWRQCGCFSRAASEVRGRGRPPTQTSCRGDEAKPLSKRARTGLAPGLPSSAARGVSWESHFPASLPPPPERETRTSSPLLKGAAARVEKASWGPGPCGSSAPPGAPSHPGPPRGLPGSPSPGS